MPPERDLATTRRFSHNPTWVKRRSIISARRRPHIPYIFPCTERFSRTVRFSSVVSACDTVPIEARDREALVALGAVNWRSTAEATAQFESRPGEGVGRRAAEFVEERGYRILHLSIAPVTLEDVFFAYTGRALRETA